MKVLVFAIFVHFALGFTIPKVLVTIFTRGIRVSIPDSAGIKSFSFHAKVGSPFKNNENGTIRGKVIKSYKEKWIFRDNNVRLKQNDLIYYWISIVYLEGNNTRIFSTKGKNRTCQVSATYVSNYRVCQGQLIVNESFDSFNSQLWISEYKFAGSPDYEFVCYTPFRRDILNFSGGFLKIRPIPFRDTYVTSEGEVNLGIRCTGIHGTSECVQEPQAFLIRPPVGSAQITTKTKWSFKYGKIYIRAKLPKGDWIYPELYLNPANQYYGPGYASGQIRIAFVQGNANMNHILQGGCILGNDPSGRSYLMRSTRRNKAWSDDFHLFSVVWKPGVISVFVDNEVYGNIWVREKMGFVHEARGLDLESVRKWQSGTPFAPFDKLMNLVIGVGVGGHCFEDRSDGTKPWNNSDPKGQKKFYEAKAQWRKTWTNPVMYVDYVKIWAL